MRRIVRLGYALAIGSGMLLPATAQVRDSWPDGQWQASVGGISHHSRETQAPGRQWNETHSGVGLHRRLRGLPWDWGAGKDWSTRLSLGTMEDSRGFVGSYGGMTVLHELTRVGRTSLEGGVSAGLYYRSASWSGEMHVVPALLPMLALTEHYTGLGVDLTWVPPAKAGSQESISTLLLQFTYRVQY